MRVSSSGLALRHAKVEMDSDLVTGSFLRDFTGCPQTIQVRGGKGLAL